MICSLLDLCDIIDKACKIDIKTAGQPEIDLLNRLGTQAIGYLALAIGRDGELGECVGFMGGEIFNACIHIENFLKRREHRRGK
jgi:hypothetical protein